MSWVALSSEKHRHKAISKSKIFDVIKKALVVDVYSFEIQKAVLCMPILFVKEEAVRPVCLMGFEKDNNLFVDSNGNWLLPHFLPASVSTFPFRVAKQDSNKRIVIVDETSSVFVDESEGERLFDNDGNVTSFTAGCLDILKKIEETESISKNVCSMFDDLGLLEPFPIKFLMMESRSAT